MRIIISIFLWVSVLLVTSCGQQEQITVERQIGKYVSSLQEDIPYFSVSNVKMQYSVTFEQEIDRKQRLFEVKRDTYKKKVKEYRKKRLLQNLQKSQDELDHVEDILVRLAEYREANLYRKDSILYYVMTFNGFGEGKEKRLTLTDYYAVVSPKMEVYYICGPEESPVTCLSFTMPGYLHDVLGKEE